MPVRHRVPSVFGLYMLDVLCCALGCVILLLLLHVHRAKRHEEAEEQKVNTLTAQLDDLNIRVNNLNTQVKLKDSEIAKLTARLNKLLKQLNDTKGDYVTAVNRAKTAEEKLKAAEARLVDVGKLAKLVPDLRQDLKKAKKDEVLTREQMERVKKALNAQLKELNRVLAELKKVQKERSDLASKLKEAEEELVLFRLTNRKLQGEVTRVRAAAANRFAGIELTGKRVVFLIDTSGSMNMLDKETKAPTKWAGVRKTVAKLMKSLPNLAKFQVITFAQDTEFLLGKKGEWLDYDPKKSPDEVVDALSKVTPSGGTDLYAPLEVAFKLREQGLDTIYLFSDGLPDRCAGLGISYTTDSNEIERITKAIRDKLKLDWNKPAGAKETRVRVNTIGFFYESPDVGRFLWALARENTGNFVGMNEP